ncbi:hypothetical protein [Nocardia carnea]|uniref:hypothetical protein n=1 Tax=Nocardia carnea TaxID=37328 RepID=UPI00245572EF|nr:hypothetical protein [Nocardia carnea]
MSLPDKDMILTACRGFPTIAEHPMLDAAAELAILHQNRETTPACHTEDIDWRRTRLMRDIDEWIQQATPVPFPAAKLHTHTMGQVVDQLAQLTTHTFLALTSPSTQLFQDACGRLDELGEAYQHLADDLACGTRRLPQ